MRVTSPSGQVPWVSGRMMAPTVPPTRRIPARDSSARDTPAGSSHMPWYPPTSTPGDGGTWQWSRTVCSGVPYGASTTWVPPIVSSVVPGSSSVPAEAYRSGPSETSTASCANVSVLDSSVG